MTPTDPRLSGWRPDFAPADEQLERQGPRLRSLVGRRVEAAWLVWNLELDEWFADLPVVLELDDGQQLELCWQKFDDLSITWGTIDLTATPLGWVDWPLEWRQGAHVALEAVVGAEIERVEVTSFRFVTTDVHRPQDTSAVWLTTGLWLGAEGGGLHLFNALDENGLSTERPTSDTDRAARPI